MEMLRQSLPPEFYNRVDEMVVFHALGKTQNREIVKIEFARRRTENRQFTSHCLPAQ